MGRISFATLVSRRSPIRRSIKFSECRQKGLTYSDPIKIMVRLVLFDREAVDIKCSHAENSAWKSNY